LGEWWTLLSVLHCHLFSSHIFSHSTVQKPSAPLLLTGQSPAPHFLSNYCPF
jgi:hypothetical protein